MSLSTSPVTSWKGTDEIKPIPGAQAAVKRAICLLEFASKEDNMEKANKSILSAIKYMNFALEQTDIHIADKLAGAAIRILEKTREDDAEGLTVAADDLIGSALDFIEFL